MSALNGAEGFKVSPESAALLESACKWLEDASLTWQDPWTTVTLLSEGKKLVRAAMKLEGWRGCRNGSIVNAEGKQVARGFVELLRRWKAPVMPAEGEG